MEKETTQCQIFLDLETNKLIDSNPEYIKNLDRYYPKHGRPYEEMDEFSNMILDIKKDERELDQKSGEYYYYEKAVNYFTKQLHFILSEEEEYVICVYPNSKTGHAFTGMRVIVKRLCKYSVHRIDGSDVLLRKVEIPRKSGGGERGNLQKEIESLAVRDEIIIKGKQVLLMDDITTTGTSLKAGKCILEQKGAKIVALLALGETV